MKLVIGTTEYPLGDVAMLNLGEQRMAKRIMGVPFHKLEDGFDVRDPDHMTFVVWLGMQRNARPGQHIRVEDIEALGYENIELVVEPGDPTGEEAPAEGPLVSGPPVTPDGPSSPASASSSNGGEGSGSETSPGTSGAPASSAGSV